MTDTAAMIPEVSWQGAGAILRMNSPEQQSAVRNEQYVAYYRVEMITDDKYIVAFWRMADEPKHGGDWEVDKGALSYGVYDNEKDAQRHYVWLCKLFNEVEDLRDRIRAKRNKEERENAEGSKEAPPNC